MSHHESQWKHSGEQGHRRTRHGVHTVCSGSALFRSLLTTVGPKETNEEAMFEWQRVQQGLHLQEIRQSGSLSSTRHWQRHRAEWGKFLTRSRDPQGLSPVRPWNKSVNCLGPWFSYQCNLNLFRKSLSRENRWVLWFMS